ncbi:MAG: hypothetical protein AAF547_09640 [Actinomycetota bacterium]
MTVGSRRTRWTTRRTSDALLDQRLVVTPQRIGGAIYAFSWARLLAGLALALALAIGGDEEPSLDLTAQHTFVAPDGELSFDLALRTAGVAGSDGSDPFISVTVYGLLTEEDELDEPLPPAINRRPPLSLDDLPIVADGVVRVTIPVRGGPAFDDRDRLLLPAAGVYPVTIELRTIDGPVAGTTTTVVRTEAEPTPLLDREVAVVVRIGPDGPIDPTAATRLLNEHPTVPLTVVLEAGALDALEADAALASALATAVGGRPVTAVTAPVLDPSALAEIGQAGLYADAVAGTRARLTALGLGGSDDLAPLETLPTAEGVVALADAGVGTILDLDGRRTEAGTVTVGGTTVRVLPIDRVATAALDGDEGLHRATRVVTALVLGDEPEPTVLSGPAADGSAPAIEPDGEEAEPFGPDGTLAALHGLLRALDEPGAPTATTVADLPLRRRLAPAERPDQNLAPIADTLDRIQAKLTTYQGFHPGGATGSTDRYHPLITAALGRDRRPDDRLGTLRELEAAIDADLAVVALHDGQPVTLAARSAPIPVVVESRADSPRQVMLRVRSDTFRSDDDQRVVEIEPGVSSIDLRLEARSLGMSPLEVELWTPDGTTRLAATVFEVRSTAIPGLGLALSGGAVGLLGAWWVIDARRRRADPIAG